MKPGAASRKIGSGKCASNIRAAPPPPRQGDQIDLPVNIQPVDEDGQFMAHRVMGVAPFCSEGERLMGRKCPICPHGKRLALTLAQAGFSN